MMVRLIWLCMFHFGTTVSTFAQLLTKEQLQRLDSISIQDVPPQAPGIATAIVKDGAVIYEKYAGLANLDDSSMIDRKTRFNIASNGKQFTALAVLLLEDHVKLKLTDDIRKTFPSLFPNVKEKITIRHLLTHSSGIRDVYDLWALQGKTWWKNSFSNTDVLDILQQQQELNFKPGSQYLYSNSNYMLLALIVEAASGELFVDFTKKMFHQLHMPETSFENNYKTIREPVARPYFNFSTWTTRAWQWNACGDGNLFSTLPDQIQWEKIIQGQSKTEIKREIISKAVSLVKGSGISNYGYGLEFGKYNGLEYSFHEGATGAWKATFIRFPAKQISFVTLTNTGKAIPYSQTRQMADVILNLPLQDQSIITKPLQSGPYISENEIPGVYLTEKNFSFEFEKRNGKLYLKRIGRNDIELKRETGNIFHQANDPLFKQEFIKNKNGELEVTAYYTTHSPYTLKKSNPNWNNFVFGSLDGKFINEETNTIIEITYTGEKNYKLKIGTRDESQGMLVMPGKLLVNSYVINFNPQIQPRILLLDGERIKKVKFTRVN